MPQFKISLTEPSRLFPTTFGELVDGAVVEADEQPGDGVTWTWAPVGTPAPPVPPVVVPQALSADPPAAPSA